MRVQAAPRFQNRLPCRVTIGASQYAGLIRNLSRSGLFVETGAVAGASPGQLVDVAVQAPTARPDIILRSRVVWSRLPERPAFDPRAGGIGVAIQSAPESYYSLLAAVARLERQTPRSIEARGTGDTTPAQGDPEPARFRVRVQQIGGARTRSFEIDAVSERAARRRALALAGADWSVTSIDRAASRRP